MPARLAPSLEIRGATLADEQFVRELSREAFGEFTFSPEQTTARMMREPRTTTLIASLSGARVGFAVVCIWNSEQASLQAIAISEEQRGRGLGQALLRHVERFARRYADELQLATSDANVAALHLFLRSGYRIARRVESYYARRQNACVLAKRLR